ncbi:F-box/kelch-repeat protein SKIP4-like [Malus domestica]|uniref:F-box/kelch-repeat protein SKIP4-like n=1 Tax=Malus domestica TaxID=3750 RepID=UPI00397520DA
MKRKGMGFEVPGKKVYLLGGCGWCEDATDEVYSYDASLNAWGEASPLSTARCVVICMGEARIQVQTSYIFHLLQLCEHIDCSFCLLCVNGTWQHAESDVVSGWRGPAVVIGGTFCVGSELRN